MAITERFLDVELVTGLNDGTSEANAWQTWAAAATNFTVSDARLNCKNPTTRFDVNGSHTITAASAGLTPVMIRGYDVTIGDGVSALYENFSLTVSGANMLVESLDILNADPASAAFDMFEASGATSNAGGSFRNCKGVRTAGVYSIPTCFKCLTGGSVYNCYAEVEGNSALNSINGIIHVQDGNVCANIVKCVGKDWGAATQSPPSGITGAGGSEDGSTVTRNIVYFDQAASPPHGFIGIRLTGKNSGTTASTSASGGYYCCNNTVVNCQVGFGWIGTAAIASAQTDMLVNNLAIGCPISYSAIYSNSTQVPINIMFKCAGDGIIQSWIPIDFIRITQDPFTDLANEDFSLNTVFGGGEALRARAAHIGGGTPDIGAIQV